ncbi:MAG: hypothetical protein ABSE16_08425 [Verrucomicrobiota bacterium]|jgi:hypothetical protein
MALVQIKGTPAIFWGASGILGAPAGAIVDSLQLTPKNGEPIEIEDSNGLAANEVLLRDGFNGKISCLYDASKLWPVEGANAALAIPFNGAGANAIPFGESSVNGAVYANNAVTYTVLVASVSPVYAKKKEAMIDLNVTYRPNVQV